MRDPPAETLPWKAQADADDSAYRAHVAYLYGHSPFYRRKLAEAGFRNPAAVGGLDKIVHLPFTEKDELRDSRTPDNPIGAHLAAPAADIARIYSTSGTTGAPSFIPLTREDLADWIEISCRSYAAAGLRPGMRLVSTYNAGPFVAAVTLDAFNALGLAHVPVGPGNSERLLAVIALLGPDAVALTPSYARHLAETAQRQGIDLAGSSVGRLAVAGEPGGGEADVRAWLEAAWGAQVTEALGIGDIAVSLWGECEHRGGMHFSGRGFVHVELIDPATGASLPLEDGAEGELVYTHLRQRAAPLLRFRSRDHVRLRAGPCPCGRTAPRARCVGRTDDMLIVRGVNLFPTAVREVVGRFAPAVSGVIAIRPRRPGVRQAPPLPVAVELAEGQGPDPALAEQIGRSLRETLLVNAEVDLVPWRSLPRSDYKSRLVDWSRAEA
jgi:phenylacetate-CoA ligase